MKQKIKQFIKVCMQNIILPGFYNLNRWRRVDGNLVVLADSHHSHIPVHMEKIKKTLLQEGYKVCEEYFDLGRLGKFEAVKKMTGFMKLYAKAGTVIICDYFLPVSSCRKKKDTRVIQLWHGAGAFKKFGYDCDIDIPKVYMGHPHKNYDLVTVSGDKCVEPFKSAMGIRGDLKAVILPIGMSITDRYFEKDFLEACRDKIRYEYPDAYGKKLVLWAPTFRGNAGSAEICGEKEIDALIEKYNNKSDIYLIKSIHPHADKEKDGRGMNTNELMVCADVLITDYSSVFFDYLLFDRPIVFFAPDYREYCKDRGFYLNYKNLPGYVIAGGDSLQELESAVIESAFSDETKCLRERFTRDYMNGCDGNATERIMNYVKGNLAL